MPPLRLLSLVPCPTFVSARSRGNLPRRVSGGGQNCDTGWGVKVVVSLAIGLSPFFSLPLPIALSYLRAAEHAHAPLRSTTTSTRAHAQKHEDNAAISLDFDVVSFTCLSYAQASPLPSHPYLPHSIIHQGALFFVPYTHVSLQQHRAEHYGVEGKRR